MPGSAVTNGLADGEPDEFLVGDLAAPVTLAAGTRYHVVTQASRPGPLWYDPTPVQTTVVATVYGPVYRSNASGAYISDSGGDTFGPLTFRHVTPDDPTERESVTSYQLTAAPRDNYTGFVGMTIDVGPSPLTVTALGRLRVRAPNWWEQWRAEGRDQNSVVADPLFDDAAGRDLDLAPDSPAFLQPVSFQPIDLGAVGPGADEQWADRGYGLFTLAAVHRHQESG